MNLRFRPAAKADFPAFYHGCFDAHRGNEALRTVVEGEWIAFLNNGGQLSMLVEDTDREVGDMAVGFAQTVFVSDAFVEYVCKDSPPHVNQLACRKLPDGSWPLLTNDRICQANSDCGLNAMMTRWGWREATLNAEEQWSVRRCIEYNYLLFYRGYKYKQLLVPAYSDFACQGLVNAGCRLYRDYADYYREHPSAMPSSGRPYLFGSTAAEARLKEGTSVSQIFDFTPPRFFFPAHDQEVLWWTLLGCSDAEVATKAGVTLNAVHKRWASIYRRIEDRDRRLLPRVNDGVRGTEKKRIVMQYVREHLEELRPYREPVG